MQTTAHKGRMTAGASLAIVIAWAVVFFGARLFLDAELQESLQLPAWVRLLVALAPVVPTALFLFVVVNGIRETDELSRRVHLEALAIAYPLAILLLMTLGLVELAVGLPREDLSYRHVWPFLVMFYFGGLAFSWRRYK